MPVLLLLLVIGVFTYFIWRSRTSSLTRDCRWRQDRKEGLWRCAFCGAVSESEGAPKNCLKDQSGR
ncbi:hypothetical protein RKLH11_2379 [Rhodobacteraceae bacterium KLH11]|nr:hypothetical protein RKLH11_2379 [Rhodobacteraceae bacterium KLH11]